MDMSPSQVADDGELEFFGVKLKVNNPRLAALLNSDVTEEVQVIGRRAREALSGADDDRTEREVAERQVVERVQHADDSVCIRLDELEGA
jgi:energy-converting hydrogenase A subunit M